MRFLIKFSYDGTNYVGFQNQPNMNTIQGALENAAFKINNNTKTSVTATGRTDKHVHARCMYAHLDLNIEITTYKLKRAFNSNLPEDIHVIETFKVKDDFHARKMAIRKTYEYYINLGEYNPLERNYVYQYNYKLNVEKMREAIKYFLGEHDFRAFVTENIDKPNCVRTIYSVDIRQYEHNSEKYVITFTGNGFMRYQVRNMVGILIKVGEEKIEVEEVLKILESKSRKKNGVTARAEGLYLKEVNYDNLDDYIIK